ncbi:MAG: hypothetical protein E6R14_11575 [Thermomicrobiales bacterium]|nr:MAG: hypothetical protein E6R14_11575 [Thermomicrobiales bacterium]
MEETVPVLIGPIQFMTVLLHTPSWEGKIADEFLKLEDEGLITIIDIAMVNRVSEDEFELIDIDSELLPGRPLLGAVVGGLIGLGAAGEEGMEVGAEIGMEDGIELVDSEELFDEMADEIPIGGTAAVVAFEQTWARTLMGAIRDNGGEILSDEIVHAEDLIDAGIELGDALLGE